MNTQLNKTPNFKEIRQTKALILSRLDKVNILWSQMSFAQHMSSILRSKGVKKDPYSWTDQELLSNIEKYIEELENDSPKFTYFETDENVDREDD